ncbi:50S ribosomal protein L25 [Caldibacillus thermolactis]|jgi:large subunit ribosomal protein L25|uniref:Large ribosomal subunit protein bL25 n=1 Tax=Pallidibacillus thermolactis TaxID=251051 RepID=A0ABT2WF84_9BACI|nr:50S ribosomal protein L25 [Pallidibacillus thermolactis]MCU9593596.1 50S ribosomal protein L25 [Pallidibacillus thermolactis]MCU9600489.1 50S ribosomal protein L25 [Pallidibacillus thermolactis subsp. kokeshiiformis]
MSTALVAEVRKDFKRSVVSQLRKNGYVPAVAYGNKEETTAISLKKGELLKVLRKHGRNAVIDMIIDGEVKKVILGDYQVDRLTQDVIHADFLFVDQKSEIDTNVPVVVEGVAKGTKLGGTLQLVLHDLDITARVTEIPEKITVDVTNLAVGDTVKVADIRDDYQSIKINHEDDETIVSVVSTGSEEEEENVEEKETVEQPV